MKKILDYVQTFLNLDNFLSKTKIILIGIGLLILAFGSGYMKGCSDKGEKIEKEVQHVVIEHQEKATEKKTIRQFKNQKVREITKKLTGKPKDRYQSCVFSTNPLLEQCLPYF